MITIKTNLKEILKKRNVSMYKICQDTGIAQSTLSNLCNNKTTMIGFETLEKLCLYLECTPSDLLIIGDTK